MINDDTREIEQTIALLYRVMMQARELDERPRTFDTGMQLSRAEIHMVQAVGRAQGSTVKAVADHLGVTKGAVSQMVARLVRKGLVTKSRAPGNDKEVALDLTNLGWRGYHAHERFHGAIADAVRAHFGARLPERLPELAEALADLSEMMRRYAAMTQDD